MAMVPQPAGAEGRDYSPLAAARMAMEQYFYIVAAMDRQARLAIVVGRAVCYPVATRFLSAERSNEDLSPHDALRRRPR